MGIKKQKHSEEYERGYRCGYQTAVNKGKDKKKSGLVDISLIPRQGNWNSISESQPVIKGYYLTTTIHHEVYCDYWNGENFDRTEAVIAWMELPNPYESEV